jgi:hypothetical protein
VADAGQRNAVRVAHLSVKLKRRNRAGVIRWGGRVVIAAFGVELIQREAVGMVVHVLVGIMFAQSGGATVRGGVGRHTARGGAHRSSVKIKARCRSFSIQVKQTQVTRECHHAGRQSTLVAPATHPTDRHRHGRMDGRTDLRHAICSQRGMSVGREEYNASVRAGSNQQPEARNDSMGEGGSS